MNVLPSHLYVYLEPAETIDPIELGLQMVVSHHVDSEEPNPGSLQKP